MTDTMTDARADALAQISGDTPMFFAYNPSTGQAIEPGYPGATAADIESACARADDAFPIYRETTLEQRAAFLEAIAANIQGLSDNLVATAEAETGLTRIRLTGEVGRTVNQLRLFAGVVREGSWLGLRCDPAQPERTPLPRPDLRLRHIPLGPVVVFGASNFPLAFSVAGGDTASALAAGCPVIVKAHQAHPGTAKLVGEAIAAAVTTAGLPDGVFSLVFASRDLSQALVRDPRVKAVGFTGSRAGGLALCRIASERAEPIPVYAEMSSTNPVFLLPEALAERGEQIADGFVTSLSMGAGQFCTNPGLVIACEGAALDAFIDRARSLTRDLPAATMLTTGICDAYKSGVAHLAGNPQVEQIARGQSEAGPTQGQAGLFSTLAAAYLSDPMLHEEVFGSTSLVVRCADTEEMLQVAHGLEGQLTVTLQMDEGDTALAQTLLPILETKAGRILANGFPTGVEVAHAMVHGGPFPSTSDSRTTSVGSLAIHRFLRPVCYQDIPQAVLPRVLRDDRDPELPCRIDGQRS